MFSGIARIGRHYIKIQFNEISPRNVKHLMTIYDIVTIGRFGNNIYAWNIDEYKIVE